MTDEYYHYVRLFKKSDPLRPIHTTRDCPSFSSRGIFDRCPRAIFRDGIVYGDTKTYDDEGFRVYREEENIWYPSSVHDS